MLARLPGCFFACLLVCVFASTSVASRRQANPGSTPDRRQIDARTTPDRRRIDTRSTPNRPQVDANSTPDRRQVNPGSTPDRRQIDARSALRNRCGFRRRAFPVVLFLTEAHVRRLKGVPGCGRQGALEMVFQKTGDPNNDPLPRAFIVSCVSS